MRCYKCGSITCSNDCDLTDIELEDMEPPAEWDEIEYD